LSDARPDLSGELASIHSLALKVILGARFIGHESKKQSKLKVCFKTWLTARIMNTKLLFLCPLLT